MICKISACQSVSKHKAVPSLLNWHCVYAYSIAWRINLEKQLSWGKICTVVLLSEVLTSRRITLNVRFSNSIEQDGTPAALERKSLMQFGYLIILLAESLRSFPDETKSDWQKHSSRRKSNVRCWVRSWNEIHSQTERKARIEGCLMARMLIDPALKQSRRCDSCEVLFLLLFPYAELMLNIWPGQGGGEASSGILIYCVFKSKSSPEWSRLLSFARIVLNHGIVFLPIPALVWFPWLVAFPNHRKVLSYTYLNINLTMNTNEG